MNRESVLTVVFREVDRVWQEWCDPRQTASRRGFVLVEESDPNYPEPTEQETVEAFQAAAGSPGWAGSPTSISDYVLNAWIRDADGRRAIAPADRRLLWQQILPMEMAFPFVLFEFCIRADLPCVDLSICLGCLANNGGRYRVIEENGATRLEPEGTHWMS
jgi:hypothetical protein